MKISIKWGAITYFNLTQPWLLMIRNELSGGNIFDGNWAKSDNGELRIPISDCEKDKCIVLITYKLYRFFSVMLGFIKRIDLKVTLKIKDSG